MSPKSEIDRALLVQLRDDPAPKVKAPPQVARRAPQQSYRRAAAPRPSDPFDGLRHTMWRVERWFRNIGR